MILGLIGHDEPFKRLLNQGMIQGSSRFVYYLKVVYNYDGQYPNFKFPPIFISKSYVDNFNDKSSRLLLTKKIIEALKEYNTADENVPADLSMEFDEPRAIHVDVNMVDGIELDMNEYRQKATMFSDAKFITEEDGKYICGVETEKMSKSKFNTVNPDDLVMKYGADTFRMYEMFLGPVEMSKPWDTKGIEGVHRFLKKFWRLFFAESKTPPSEGLGEALIVTNDEPTAAELKVLHHTIRKIESDTERFSFNTGVSAFMIATNDLTDLKCHKRKILEPLLILLAPYAPHISEELYHILGSSQVSPLRGDLEGASILNATFPRFEEKYVKETTKAYPVAINGKTRSELTLSLDATQEQVEQLVLQDPAVQKWLDGKTPKKLIYVKNKMINIVI